jgi:hypothetical protein
LSQVEARRRQRAAAEAQRQHAERTQAVFTQTGLAVGARVQVDGAGFGTVVDVTAGSQIRVRVGRYATDFSPDQLRVADFDDAPASPAIQTPAELAAPAPMPTLDTALDATPVPAASTRLTTFEDISALLEKLKMGDGGSESTLDAIRSMLREEVAQMNEREGDDAAPPLQQVRAAPAAIPSPGADLVGPQRAVETAPAPVPTAMDEDEPAATQPMIIRIKRPPARPATAPPSPRMMDIEGAPAAEITSPQPPVARAAPTQQPHPEPRRSARRAASDASAPAERPAKKRDWTPAEDDKLRAALGDGLTGWKAIAARVGTRNDAQCRERWEYQLNPEINKSEFTSEEDAYLLALPQPGDWKNVVKKLPGPGGRTDMAVKTRYHTLMKRKRAPKKRKRKR